MRETKTIGSILLDVELVTPQDIDEALELQKKTGKRLGEVLVSLGLVSDDDIRWALAEQLNLPYVNIRKDQIDIDVATLIPEKLARRYHVIPILKIDNELTVVVDDPLNTTIIKDIERITKSQVKISLGRTSDILLAIDEIYGVSKDTLQRDLETPPHFISSWFHEEDIQRILNDPSGYALMEQVLTVALTHGVSRIYFQPGDHVCHISYRVNTGLQEQIQLSREWYSIVLFRLKISAGFDIAEVHHPQYREFSYQAYVSKEEDQAPEEKVTLAVSILPAATGEAVVIKVINKSVENLWLLKPEAEISPLQRKELAEFHRFRSSVHHLKCGTVLLGGTPYLDKISTLYSLLNELDPIRKKIVTLESSSEYRADKYYQIKYAGSNSSYIDAEVPPPGIANLEQPTQAMTATVRKAETPLSQAHLRYYVQPAVQILHPEQQLLSTWLSVLKEQDVDVLFVDHIASAVILAQCLDFAAYGVLFASLGQKHVFEMLAYVLDCQIEPSVITSRVYALIAQHTVRILCEQCKRKETTDFGKSFFEQFRLNEGQDQTASSEIYTPGGCPECNMSGYAAQIVLFEVLLMEPWIKERLRSGASLAEIQRTAGEKGFVSLKKKSLDLLFSGQTSLEEVFSIVT